MPPQSDAGFSRPFAPPIPTGQASAAAAADAYALIDVLFDLLNSAFDQIADLEGRVTVLENPGP